MMKLYLMLAFLLGVWAGWRLAFAYLRGVWAARRASARPAPIAIIYDPATDTFREAGSRKNLTPGG